MSFVGFGFWVSDGGAVVDEFRLVQFSYGGFDVGFCWVFIDGAVVLVYMVVLW